MRQLFALIKWGVWQRRWFIFWWALAVIFFVFINMVFYPSFRDQAAQAEESFSQLSSETRSFITDSEDFFSPVGYLSSQIFYLLLPMLLAILAITLGSSLLAREEKDGTIELLLSRPVSRTTLLIGKSIVGFGITLAVAIASISITIVMAKLVELSVPAPNIFMAGIMSFLFAFTAGAIAFFITTLGKARIASVGIATLAALGGYIVVSLVQAASWLKWPSKFFPFNYYHPADILSGNYQARDYIILAAIPVVCAVLSWLAFRRRDISN